MSDEYYFRRLWYATVFCLAQPSSLKQITDRNPHLIIPEVGAGTWGATKDVLSIVGHNLDAYTFTDVSSGLFGEAVETLASWKDEIAFSVLDVESRLSQQGFSEGTYDVIVSSLVIHSSAL